MSYLAKKQNRLADEELPYLLQHACNPIDWYPWGDEAFLKAKRENKPIFLSMEYSSCHWCHVMEREVFENEELAELLNRLFVSIKVDREERLDIDKHFQHIHYNLQGAPVVGLPLFFWLRIKNCFLPPHIYCQIIALLSNKFKKEYDEVVKVAENISQVAKTEDRRVSGKLDFELLPILKNVVQNSFDRENGGLAGEPKFPHAALLMLMLESKDKKLIEMAAHTLKCMAKGGMYDTRR